MAEPTSPPEPKYGRPSFLQVLERISSLWQERGESIRQSADQMHEQLRELTTAQAGNGIDSPEKILSRALKAFKGEYDPRHGGFGNAPKFPRPTQPAFMLQQAIQHGDQEAIRMVLHTCERMAAGGMYDQLGGGFARYSVDAEWLVPHFEKMLYDNAQLLHLYLDAHLISGDPQYAAVARDILRYVLRDMTHPEGGFYSAEDADSEGKEGKFYTWTRDEVQQLLSPEEFQVAIRYFGITEKGNFVDHSDPDPLLNQNVLSIVDPKLDAAEQALLAAAKDKLFHAREQRVRPHLDDKILASWNGLMLSAIARAGMVLGEEDYLAAAEKNLAFLETHLWDAKTKTLYNRWRDGERDSVQLLDAYANLAAGVISLYEATLDPAHLQFAVELCEAMVQRFYDPAAGGFWQSAEGACDLILRIKEDYDGAEPSGNSVAILVLLKMSAITDRPAWRSRRKIVAPVLGTARTVAPGRSSHAAGVGLLRPGTNSGADRGRPCATPDARSYSRGSPGISTTQGGAGHCWSGGGVCPHAAPQGRSRGLPLHWHRLPGSHIRPHPIAGIARSPATRIQLVPDSIQVNLISRELIGERAIFQRYGPRLSQHLHLTGSR